MTETKTDIYIVTKGDYSDYHIHSVWTDEAQAERVADLFDAEVETWEVDHLPIRYQIPRFEVKVRTDGQATIHPAYEFEYDDDTELYAVEFTDPNAEPDDFRRSIWYDDDVAYYTVLVAAPTREQAMKAALDRIAHYRAVEQGIADGGVVDEDGQRADAGLPLIGGSDEA